MGFSRQEYLSSFHILLQGIFPIQGLNLHLCTAGRFFTTEPHRNPLIINSRRYHIALLFFINDQLLGCITDIQLSLNKNKTFFSREQAIIRMMDQYNLICVRPQKKWLMIICGRHFL